MDTLISIIPISKQDRLNIVDLGCGTGILALRIKSQYPNARITCLDIDEVMIKVSKQKLEKFSDIK